MTVHVSRLRMWFAIGAIFMVVVVTGAYFYAKWRVENALKEVPGKIGIDIKQSAKGFTISKSIGPRTLFKIQASKAVEYKKGGIAELHNVNITIYGEDSSRFDQICGDDFEYDSQSGNVTAQGEVQIDLEANPAGLASPDQSIPQELKNPIHLKTSGLVFNQKTGDGFTTQKVEFQIPQASGSAVGADYAAKTGVLTLHSQIHVVANGAQSGQVNAARGMIAKQSRTVTLEQVQITSDERSADADKTILYLDSNNKVEHALLTGNVHLKEKEKSKQTMEARADQLAVRLTEGGAGLRQAIFSGNVQLASASLQKQDQQMQMTAGRATAKFEGKNTLTSIHAEDNVKLFQHQNPSQGKNGQDVELSAPAMDFVVADGHLLKNAETSGPPQISIHEVAAKKANTPFQQALVTAGQFTAQFDNQGRIASIHGEPSARIVVTTPGQPDHISTSNVIDANFHPGTGIDSLTQQGNLVYTDKDQKAWADQGRYTTSDQMLVLTGSPRVEGSSMSVSAQTFRLNRARGDAVAEGDVRATYTDMKAQPNGALLATSSPIHVTAQKMTAHKTPSVALFTGSARLWQDANVVQASSIEFDRNHRSINAVGIGSAPVSTVLMQADKRGKVTPVTITSSKLQYTDTERQIHFTGGVTADGSDLKLVANLMDVFLAQNQKPNEGAKNASKDIAQPGKIDKIVATGNVLITQPDRRATGEQLTYTSADDKFVLSGNSPSIFDAEHGKITGVSLTFFRHDDTVQVEGNTQFPAITHTQMAR
jgi:lipopolysaccharide export system protein LptA